MAAGPGSLGEQGREAEHPPVDRDVVDLDAAFGEQFLDVAVGQAEAQVPADREHDHLRWEAEAGERRPCDGGGAGAASSHGDSLPLGLAHSRCNSAVEKADFVATRAITMSLARRVAVADADQKRSSWLVTYDRFDNAGVPSATQILPELQQLAGGDLIPMVVGRTSGST